MPEVHKISCPYCGAPVNAEDQEPIRRCQYCGQTFAISDLEAPAEPAPARDEAPAENVPDDDPWAQLRSREDEEQAAAPAEPAPADSGRPGCIAKGFGVLGWLFAVCGAIDVCIGGDDEFGLLPSLMVFLLGVSLIPSFHRALRRMTGLELRYLPVLLPIAILILFGASLPN